MDNLERSEEQIENKYTFTILMCAIFGSFGIHRFINGKIGSGIAMLLSCGGLGLWVIIDLITILKGEFEDGNGNLITTQNKYSMVNEISSAIVLIKIRDLILFIIIGRIFVWFIL